MKIAVEPGRVIRLTARTNSSNRGGEYDLAELGLTKDETARILACAGVSEIKSTARAAGKDDGK